MNQPTQQSQSDAKAHPNAAPLDQAPRRKHDIAPDDPRRLRGPLSFVRRSERLSGGQERAWQAHQQDYVIAPVRGTGITSVDPHWRFDAVTEFGRKAPLTVEIGSGQGENIVAAAAQHPQQNFLAVEVYIPGLARTVVRAQELLEGDRFDGRVALPNLRLLEANAPEFLLHSVPPGSVDELWVFFSDPWPKARHHKRRLINPPFIAAAAQALRPDGLMRLATDWQDYADHMLEVLDASDLFDNVQGPGQRSPRFEGRVLTAFENKGIEAGRQISDFTYRRREA